jgi:hypothetical protein
VWPSPRDSIWSSVVARTAPASYTPSSRASTCARFGTGTLASFFYSLWQRESRGLLTSTHMSACVRVTAGVRVSWRGSACRDVARLSSAPRRTFCCTPSTASCWRGAHAKTSSPACRSFPLHRLVCHPRLFFIPPFPRLLTHSPPTSLPLLSDGPARERFLVTAGNYIVVRRLDDLVPIHKLDYNLRAPHTPPSPVTAFSLIIFPSTDDTKRRCARARAHEGVTTQEACDLTFFMLISFVAATASRRRPRCSWGC